MRRLVLIAVLVVPLAAATPAFGKEVLSVSACGSDDCTTSQAGGFMRAMTDVGPPTGAPAAPARFYRLNVAVGEGDEVAGRDKLWWVPSAGRLLTIDGTWIAARPEIRSRLESLTRGLSPLPASKLPGFPAEAPDAAPPSHAPPASSAPAQSDVPAWPFVGAAVVLLIAGLLVRARRVTSRPSGALR
jgi:hypothetical protein